MSLEIKLIESENKVAKMENDLRTVIRTLIGAAEMVGINKNTFANGVNMSSIMGLVPQIMIKVQMGSFDPTKMQELAQLGTIVKDYVYLVDDVPELAEFFKK
jgi:hypothetical protein